MRALHHYEEVGLLTPAERTPAGHRLYGSVALERLYQISLLRRYGMSLDQMQRTLDDDEWSLASALTRHLDHLESEIDEQHGLRAGLIAALVDVFGFTPGELTTDPDGNVVHGEVVAGYGVIWLHQETDEFGLASPASVGAATATMAIMVDDVDEHHRLVAEKSADVLYEPVDQPYGYREYSVRDPEGALWSFMKPLK